MIDEFDVKRWACSNCGYENKAREINGFGGLIDTRLRCHSCDTLLQEGFRLNYIWLEYKDVGKRFHTKNYPAWVEDPAKLFGLVWSGVEEAYVKKVMSE